MTNDPPVLSDPLAVRVLCALHACGDDCTPEQVGKRLGDDVPARPGVAAAAILRRLAEAGLVSYRPGPGIPNTAGLPTTLHSLTVRGRERARSEVVHP